MQKTKNRWGRKRIYSEISVWCIESTARLRMAAGIMERYRQASVPPPVLLCEWRDQQAAGHISRMARPPNKTGYLAFHAEAGCGLHHRCSCPLPCLHGLFVCLHFWVGCRGPGSVTVGQEKAPSAGWCARPDWRPGGKNISQRRSWAHTAVGGHMERRPPSDS